MADIRNDQYLHRPGAGRGAVTPSDPLEARLYDGAGNPITPATETTLAAVQAAVGATNDSAVAAGAAGTVSAKLRRVTADLGSILERLISDLGASGDAAAAPGAAGSVNAKLRRLTADLADILALLNRDRRGPAANRPAANSVPVGTVYWSVDTGDVSVSTGTTWRSLGVA